MVGRCTLPGFVLGQGLLLDVRACGLVCYFLLYINVFGVLPFIFCSCRFVVFVFVFRNTDDHTELLPDQLIQLSL